MCIHLCICMITSVLIVVPLLDYVYKWLCSSWLKPYVKTWEPYCTKCRLWLWRTSWSCVQGNWNPTISRHNVYLHMLICMHKIFQVQRSYRMASQVIGMSCCMGYSPDPFFPPSVYGSIGTLRGYSLKVWKLCSLEVSSCCSRFAPIPSVSSSTHLSLMVRFITV